MYTSSKLLSVLFRFELCSRCQFVLGLNYLDQTNMLFSMYAPCANVWVSVTRFCDMSVTCIMYVRM